MFGSKDYKRLSPDEISQLVLAFGVDNGVAIAVQQVLNEICKPAKQPARVVGNGFDMGVRWAIAYPRLAEAFVNGSDPMYQAMGADRELVARAVTEGIWRLFENSGVFESEDGEQIRATLSAKMKVLRSQ